MHGWFVDIVRRRQDLPFPTTAAQPETRNTQLDARGDRFTTLAASIDVLCPRKDSQQLLASAFMIKMEDRKARIAALRAKAGRAKPPEATSDEADKSASPEPVLVSLANSSDPPSKKKQKGEEEKKESVIDRALRQAQAEAKSNPSTAHIEDLAPKKVNADLKREIQPKLDKLERRTQKAIVALLRERLEREAGEEIDD